MEKERLMKKIHSGHIKQLKHLNVPHKKFVICFSGIAGSGKTYIAKILERKYKGVRIRTDDIRGIVEKLIKKNKLNPEDKDSIVYKYLEWLIKNYNFKNNLIILDAGVDRKDKSFFENLKKENYEVFIIRLIASRKVLEKRVFERNNRPDKHFNNEVDRWTREWKEFGKKTKSDIIIENEKNNKLNLDSLFRKLDKLLMF